MRGTTYPIGGFIYNEEYDGERVERSLSITLFPAPSLMAAVADNADFWFRYRPYTVMHQESGGDIGPTRVTLHMRSKG